MVYVVRDVEDFDSQLVKAEEKLVLVDFFATWCGPCKMIAPRLDELATKYVDKLIILKVDVDECEDLATRYQIASMPTFVFIKNCEVVTQFSGANANKLEELINEHAA